MSNKYPLRLALIGAGIFAREAHIPAINALGRETIDIKALYSRTEKSAKACAELIPYAIETTTDLTSVLERKDIDAVDILLPIGIQEEVVRSALERGKHVVSEKPVATDIETGRRMIAVHRKMENQVWMVAENYRYNGKLLKASDLIRNGEIGTPLIANLFISMPFTEDNMYYHTDWRRDDSFRGGALMDAGVHLQAAIRLILGEIERVSVVATKTRADLPSINTLCGTLTFESGCIGSLSITYASCETWNLQLIVCGESGILVVADDHLNLFKGGVGKSIPYDQLDDVQAELEAFSASVCQGKAHRNSPEQALQDVAVIDALLRSAETGKAVAVERVIQERRLIQS